MDIFKKGNSKDKKVVAADELQKHLDVEPKPPGDLTSEIATAYLNKSKLDDEISESKKRPYKRTGKYKKVPEPEPEAEKEQFTADGLKPLVIFASTFLEKRLGDWAKFDDEELKQLPVILEGLANKYIKIVNEYPEETAALMFISAWVGKRMKQLWELLSNESKEKSDNKSSTGRESKAT